MAILCTYCSFFVLLISIIFYFLLPDHGHGSFLNPLNATRKRIDHEPEKWKNYTKDFINGKIEVVGVGEPKIVNTFDDVKVQPSYVGWGEDNTLGINYYKMTDELYEKLCPSWESLSEQLKKQEFFDVTIHRSGIYGSQPFGCSASERTKMNGTFSDIDELGSLYFNSKFLAPDELSAKMKKWNQAYVSSFYSNFKNQRLTSPAHNAMVPSVAITCSGNKSWIFARPRSIAKYGARTFQGASFMRGMDENEEQFVVHTGPGSIITFPPYWVHWVITNPGLSFMYTLRLKYPGNMFFIFLKRLFVERLTVFYMIPEWYFREALQSTFNRILGYQKLDSSFETGDDATDIHGFDCANRITKEELDGLYTKCKSVQKEY